MVLFNSSSACFSSSRTSSPCSSLRREESTGQYSCFKTKSQPIKLRSPYSMVDDEATSPLSSSADSVRSSCSTRSCAERDAERAEKRRLLDCGMSKMRSNSNMPLRKHLLVFNTVKHLQHDLDLLDDEELYCELMSPAPLEKCCHDDKAMEVDVLRSWLAPVVSVPSGSARVQQQPAPLKMEERVAPATGAAPLLEDVVRDQQVHQTKDDQMWDWLNESKAPAKITTSTTSTFGNGLFADSNQDYSSSGLDSASSFSSWSGWSSDSSNWTSDTWTPFDLEDSSLSRFELQHLFPSQLLLQA